MTNSKPKVFLGGTCGKSTWRETLIPQLAIDYFNPVVPNWTPECQERELEERANCDYVLYVITSEMEGVYSIAEVTDDSNKRPEKTVFCFLPDGFNEKQIKSLKMVGRMVKENGGFWAENLNWVVIKLNKEYFSPTIKTIQNTGLGLPTLPVINCMYPQKVDKNHV